MATLYERYRDVLRRAHLAAARGRRTEALAAYEAAAEMLPQRAVPRIGIGRMHLALGDPRAARAAFVLAQRLEPANADAQDGLARVDALEATVTPARGARPAATAAVPILPGLADHEVSGGPSGVDRGPRPPLDPAPADPPAVRAAAERWDAAHAAGHIDGLLEAAQGFMRLGRTRAAALALHDALEVDPQHAPAYEVAAWMEQRAGQAARARVLRTRLGRFLEATDAPDDLERAREAAETTGNVAALLAIADEHRRRGRQRSAGEVLSDALGLAPADVDVHLAIARLAVRPGVRPAAGVVASLELLARLVELDDDRSGRARLAAFVRTELQVAT